MEEGSPTKKEVCVVKESVDEIDENQLCKDASIGDVIWAKLNGSFWWPAQVCEVIRLIPPSSLCTLHGTSCTIRVY